jgi:hypothetical protein
MTATAKRTSYEYAFQTLAAARKTSLEEAQQVLTAIKGQSSCAEDVLTHSELNYELGSDVEPVVAQFGVRGLRLAQLLFQLHTARLAVTSASKQLVAAGRVTRPISSNLVATAQHFRLGACAELSMLCWLQRADFVRVITAPRNAKSLSVQQQAAVHYFILCNTSSYPRSGSPLTELDQLQNAIVIDPFFNFTCRMSELNREGRPLVDYWKAHNHTVIYSATSWDVDHAQQKALVFGEAELIFGEAQKEKHLKAAYADSESVNMWRKLSGALTRTFQPQFDQALAALVPGTRWTTKLKDDGNYDLTTRDKVKETSARLTQLGIEHTLVAGIAIALRNPDPEAFTVKALSEDMLVGWTGLQAPQVRLILKLAGLI